MAKIIDQINIEEDGIYLVFGVTDEEQLKLLHFSSKPFQGMDEDEQYIREGFQLVQVNFSGYNRPYEKQGNKYIVTAPGYLLTYVGIEDKRNEIGRRLVITQQDEITGAKVVSYLQFYNGTSTLRIYHEVVNEGAEEQTLEYVSSFYYLGIEKEGKTSSDDKMRLTYACHGWQKEMNFRTVTFPQMGLGQTQPTVNQRTSSTFELTNTGNWSTKKYLPMGYLENTEADTAPVAGRILTSRNERHQKREFLPWSHLYSEPFD